MIESEFNRFPTPDVDLLMKLEGELLDAVSHRSGLRCSGCKIANEEAVTAAARIGIGSIGLKRIRLAKSMMSTMDMLLFGCERIR